MTADAVHEKRYRWSMRCGAQGLGATIIGLSLLAQPTYAKNPCEALLCMASVIQGGGEVGGCSGAVDDYFSIVKFKKGKFSASRTKHARGKFLGSCPGEAGWASQINSIYGAVKMFSL